MIAITVSSEHGLSVGDIITTTPKQLFFYELVITDTSNDTFNIGKQIQAWVQGAFSSLFLIILIGLLQ